jgi:hypothetical protein
VNGTAGNAGNNTQPYEIAEPTKYSEVLNYVKKFQSPAASIFPTCAIWLARRQSLDGHKGNWGEAAKRRFSYLNPNAIDQLFC